MRKEGFLTIILYVLMVLLCVGLGVFVYMNIRANQDQAKEIADQAEQLAQEQALAAETPTPAPTPTPVRNTETTTLAFCGDFVGQEGLISDAQKSEGTTSPNPNSATYDFSPLFSHVKSALTGVNFASCTLDGVMTDSAETEAYCCPLALASSLKDTGFSLVNTATDNSMISGLDGVTKTLSALDAAGLAHTGTYNSKENHDANSGVQFMTINGLNVAFLSYTYGTNGVSVADNSWCVNILTTDYMTDQTKVDYDRISADLTAAKNGGADLVVCYVYWWDDTQYYTSPKSEQQDVVDYLCKNGVDIVIGGGVKTPQPIEIRQVDRGNGKTVNCAVCYSLGNLASCLSDMNTQLSAILYIDVKRDVDHGDVWISNVRYKPIFMLSTDSYSDISNPTFRYRILTLQDALNDYANGKSETDCLSKSVNSALTDGLKQLHNIMGADYDESTGGASLDPPAI